MNEKTMPQKLAGKKIIIVEDEEFLRELLTEIFQLEGAAVTEALNGTEALELLKLSKYDIVFSDVRMPGGDGIALMKTIHKEFPDPPRRFLCSGFSDINEDQLKKIGVEKLFAKPFNTDDLIETLASEPLGSGKTH